MHKQKYYKKENQTINKDNLIEIIGNRTELEPYVGEVMKCPLFVTNSLGYNGNKRLLTEIRIPGTNYYIKHLWISEHNLPIDKIQHGYRKVDLKVIEYKNQITDDVKYGVKIAMELPFVQKEEKMIIPKWKQEQKEDQLFKAMNTKPKVKSPFKKIKIIRKAK